jgi:hypothetical protein
MFMGLESQNWLGLFSTLVDLTLVDLSNFCAVAISGIPIRRSPDVFALRVATAIYDDERLDIRVKTKGLTERLNQRYSGKGAHDGLKRKRKQTR